MNLLKDMSSTYVCNFQNDNLYTYVLTFIPILSNAQFLLKGKGVVDGVHHKIYI